MHETKGITPSVFEGTLQAARGLILWETRYAHTHPEVGKEKRE